MTCGLGPVWATSLRYGIGDINADGDIQVKEPGLGLEFSVRKSLCRSMQKIWLWRELGCNSHVRASVRSS